MSTSASSRIVSTFAVGFAIFIVAILLPKFFLNGAVPKIATTQALELTLSVLAIAILGKARFADYGFRWLRGDYLKVANMGRIALAAGGSAALGMAATGAILITGAQGNPLAKELTLPQIVLFVWLFSSIIEEIFTRGFIQSHIAQATESSIKFVFFRVQIPVLLSALAFASMHLVLLRSGADLKTLVIILLFTFSVGLLAGHERSRSGSLLPAIGIHMLANIGGMVGGILYGIISVLTGHGIPAP